MSRKLTSLTGLILLLVVLLGINILSNATLRGKRIDLTESKLYTLSEGSRNIVAGLEEPIKLRFFFSEKATNNIPFLRAYGTRVREFLEEYVAASNGKLTLEIIDPQPFSEAEDRAVAAGIQGVPISQTDKIYFGLQGVNSTDLEQTIPFFNQEKEQFLEYDISSLIHNLATTRKPKLALISPLPVAGSRANPMAAMMGQPPQNEPWAVYTMLRELYDVQTVETTATELPADTDIVMVIHPKNLGAQLQYAIDQFVLGGGRAIVFVDPHAEADQPTSDPSNPMAAMTAERSSAMPELLKAWGVEMVPGKVLTDRKRSIQVNAGSRQRPEIVNYIAYFALTNEDFNREEYTVSQLETLRFAMPGALRRLDDAATEFIPLVQSTEDSMLIDVEKFRFFPQPKELLAEFKPENKRYTIAARISGKPRTAYPDGPQGGVKSDKHLDQASSTINVIVVSDVDVLTDPLWVQRQQFFGQSLIMQTANNGDLAVNLVDQLAGSNDLISIRARGKFNRPFTVVERLQQQANERHAAKLKELEDKLAETERRINELQRGRTDGASNLILTQEQREEIERFREERVRTAKELRRVQLALRQDIENLGARIKFYNIGLMPIAVGLLAIVLGTVRHQRRRRSRA